MNFAKQLRTVLWSLIGLGRRQDMAEIPQRGSPLLLVLIAFILVVMFLATLAAVAHLAARG